MLFSCLTERIDGTVLHCRWSTVWPCVLRVEPREEWTILLFFPVEEMRSDILVFRTDVLCDYYRVKIPVEGSGAQKPDLFPYIWCPCQLAGETYFLLCWSMVDVGFGLVEIRELHLSPAWRKAHITGQYMKHCTYLICRF